MENIKAILKDKRPNLSDGSIKTYLSIIKSIHKKVFLSNDINLENFNKYDEILEYLKSTPANRRKTILSALVVLTDNTNYRDQMLTDVGEYNEEMKKQEMTDTQRTNWISTDEINDVFRGLENDAKILYRKVNKTSSDIQQIQNYIIVVLCSGIFFPPRRALDWCEMRNKGDINKETDNYIDKGKFIFNKYKTSKTYGQQELLIPVQVKNILNRWVALNNTDYLLHDTNGNPLNSVKLNQRINAIFGGKKVSVNNFRHTYLTDKYKQTSEETRKLQQDMADMGSSLSMATTYIKLN